MVDDDAYNVTETWCTPGGDVRWRCANGFHLQPPRPGDGREAQLFCSADSVWMDLYHALCGAEGEEEEERDDDGFDAAPHVLSVQQPPCNALSADLHETLLRDSPLEECTAKPRLRPFRH